MDVKLIVGCAVLIPLIVVLVVSAWKYWNGKWPRFVAGWNFAPDELPDSPYHKRRAKRIALSNLFLAIAFASELVLLAVDQLGNSPASGTTWPFVIFTIWCIGSCIYIFGGSRRDSKAIAKGVAGTGPGLTEAYEFGTRQITILVVIILLFVALEIMLSLLDRGF